MFCVRLDRPSRLGVAAVKSAQEVAGFFRPWAMNDSSHQMGSFRNSE